MPEGGIMVFDAILNHISVISQRSFLLVEETRVPTKTTDIPQVTDKLYHIIIKTNYFPMHFNILLRIYSIAEIYGLPEVRNSSVCFVHSLT